MRILHFILILAVSILLKNVYCDSSNPLPNASPNFQVLATDIQLDDERRRAPTPRRPPPPRSPPPSPPPPRKVNAFLMVVQWPHGVCSGTGRRCEIPTVPTEFKIHGLWPQFTDKPEFKTFDPQTLANISSALKESWPNLYDQTQLLGGYFAFWGHEWRTHGAYSEMEGLAYFKKALELYSAVGQGLKAKLAAEQIRPGGNYTLVQMNTALQKINGGFSCTVRCVPSRIDNVLQLQEIRFRYDRNFNKQNNNAASNCGIRFTT